MNSYSWVAIFFYILGCVLWFYLWRIANGFNLFAKNKFLYFPFILTPLVLIGEILFILWNPVIGDFKSEQELIQVIERNNQQLITATFGVLVLAVALMNFKTIARMSREFVFFISFSLICSVGGVLMLYWLPITGAHAYFVLRHFKTIPYTFSIGFFLSALLLLIQEILRNDIKSDSFSLKEEV